MAFLIQKSFGDATAGNLTGTALIRMVNGDRLRIGRGGGSDLLLADAGVALAHAELRRLAGGGVEVADLDSTTGTFLNGRKVQKATVASGDWVEIGRTRITLEFGDPAMPVLLNVRELEEAPERPAATAVAGAAQGAGRVADVAQVDHVARYRLPAGLLGRRSLSFLALTAAVAVLVWLLSTESFDALRPGSVSQSHASLAGACFACHAPWSGPADDRCVTCHDGPEHQPVLAAAASGVSGLTPAAAAPVAADARGAITSVTAGADVERRQDEPPCTSCHVEHRSRERLAVVTNELCVDCHAELDATSGRTTGRFANTVTDFAVDHPEFTVPVRADEAAPAAAGAGVAALQRARLSDVERLTDPTQLRLRHQVHLRPDLKSTTGRRQLGCQDCHAFDAATGEIAPLQFEAHCEECHRLDFDSRLGPAPHRSGEEVHAYLLAAYLDLDSPAPPLVVRKRLLPRQRVSPSPAPPRVPQRVLDQVTVAESKLFRQGAHCDKCHLLTQGGVVPDVEPPDRPRPWFAHGRFTHESHRMRDCEDCHARSRASDATEDVLIPGVELCRTCHGSEAPSSIATTRGAGATTRCVSCHTYHDKSKVGWEAVAPSRVGEDSSGQVAASAPNGTQ